MSRLISREDAVRVLRRAGCSDNVIQHAMVVEKVALLIAKKISANGHHVDIDFVGAGALLHDIGRSRGHGIGHGVEGGKILRELGLEKFVCVAERHVGAGIPAGEAVALGLPRRDFIPRTLEEKIITYADKLVMGGRKISYSRALDWFKSELGAEHPAIERFKHLHSELKGLMEKKQ
ncbi:MAG: TIGR00295 family protein [Candidatus Hadarchaeota archaeon]